MTLFQWNVSQQYDFSMFFYWKRQKNVFFRIKKMEENGCLFYSLVCLLLIILEHSFYIKSFPVCQIFLLKFQKKQIPFVRKYRLFFSSLCHKSHWIFKCVFFSFVLSKHTIFLLHNIQLLMIFSFDTTIWLSNIDYEDFFCLFRTSLVFF